MIEHAIKDFIPQREPFILLDQLEECNEAFSLSSFIVTSDHILCNDGYLQEGGLIENIAQTAAAGHGYTMSVENKDVVRGFIGAIKNLKIHQLPAVGTKLFTKVDNEGSVMNVNIVQGSVKDINGTVYAECEMKIFLEE